MNMSTPPVVAGWLLNRTGVSGAVCGDLAEEYHRGRSRLWFWWQAIVAILVNIVREVTENKGLAVQAILIGFGCSALIHSVTFAEVFWILNHRATQSDAWHQFWFVFLPVAVVVVPAMLTGWLVGRFYSERKFGIVCAYAGVVWIVQLANVAGLSFVNQKVPIDRWWPIERWWYEGGTLIVSTTGILVAGLLVNREQDDIVVATVSD